ncbi:Na+/H+ antiporter NhaC family protein [Staphylococcus pseudintermedius]|uniref:Na+/H+ antiporter NhaC family protein n=1 Tax=Staphylococcus pseudintermedius TaxID=283734 RepID=UPI0018E1D936|nr:Na+/H+ antiporter NhaC family protein [Staphylococcus pseudintermedius]EGQ1598172.1 Na+/H+ antiporter NhaC family protein [Staphylococcus pseudintermedius]EGQ2904881.1 Na+/H+ antiporter NhaC family protein [Staphylococcus pseudintermedius]EGQ3263741.1 Na+/H+ antiporter NhaC family protein [Staphylococcus pseudintermedius]EGQ3299983.1 Na+/H+ antiporter NhaC family protein [Staphylococcus pseudintermedius]EGQ3347767.1 Na+/H+ antiporter NhaC family protein [Staphylococcus pseudintermedius]
MLEQEHEHSSPWALIPLVVFISIFLGAGIITKDFTFMPLNVAAIIGVVVALLMNRRETFMSKVEVFARQAGHANIVLMMFIFLLAGAFSKTTEAMGGVTSIVNLGLSFIPQNFLIVGLFIICMFISISMGTSVGTVAAIAPVGFGISEATEIPAAFAMATVVGGAMFGDNLSMISDTTIAAVRTQKTQMSDKFKVNFRIVVPGAIVTIFVLWWLSHGYDVTQTKTYDFEWVKVVPYLFVLILAVIGINVVLVLLGGILLSSLIGLIDGSFNLGGLLKAASEGVLGMQDIAMIALLIGGMIGLVEHHGGITWLLNFVKKRVKTRRGAELGIASLVSVADISTANNTISIIMAGPLAKDIAEEYDIDPRKSASLLDIFGSAFQGFVPYSPQLIAAAGVASISPVTLLPYSIYPVMLAICGIIAILFNLPRLRSHR